MYTNHRWHNCVGIPLSFLKNPRSPYNPPFLSSTCIPTYWYKGTDSDQWVWETNLKSRTFSPYMNGVTDRVLSMSYLHTVYFVRSYLLCSVFSSLVTESFIPLDYLWKTHRNRSVEYVQPSLLLLKGYEESQSKCSKLHQFSCEDLILSDGPPTKICLINY